MGKPTSDEMKKMEVTPYRLCQKTFLSCITGVKEIPSGTSRDGLLEGQDIVRFSFPADAGKRCATCSSTQNVVYIIVLVIQVLSKDAVCTSLSQRTRPPAHTHTHPPDRGTGSRQAP
jgi:hypothetical protein